MEIVLRGSLFYSLEVWVVYWSSWLRVWVPK